MDKPLSAVRLAQLREAAKLGGRRRHELYGNFGTPEGRAKGGRNSGPAQRQVIRSPEQSPRLAEAVGIILGDGGVTDHQVSIYLDRKGDDAYSIYVQILFQELFGIPVARRFRENVIIISLSSGNLVAFLAKIGVNSGNKVRRQADIPNWVKENATFARACLRGLMDTDGCVYSDRHLKGEKEYRSLCVAFTNHSQPLLQAAQAILAADGIRYTVTRYDVKIRKRLDVKKFARVIGFSNAKHKRKVEQFFGEVA